MSPSELVGRIESGTAPFILDVRSAFEFRRGHVPGAVRMSWWRLLLEAPEGADPDRPVVVYCGHGPRAALARRALEARGFRDVSLLRGHMSRWRSAGHPVER